MVSLLKNLFYGSGLPRLAIFIGLLVFAIPLGLASPAFADDDLIVYEGFGAFDSATFAKYPGFGSPIYSDEDGNVQVGFDSGICNVTYTAAQMVKVVAPLEGASGKYGTQGLYECTWTTHITSGSRKGSITTSGTFPFDPAKPSSFSIIGGTGDFNGAKGTLNTDANPNCRYSKDPKTCILKETFTLIE